MLAVALVVFFFEASAPNPMYLGEELGEETFEVKEYSPGDTLSVISYNIGYLSGMTNNRPLERPKELVENNQQRMLGLFHAKNPDFIGIQEIDFGAKRSYEVNQGSLIRKSSRFSDFYFSTNWNKRYVPFPFWPISAHFGKIISGQAIFSRFSLSNTETIKLDNPIKRNFLYKAFYLDRLIQIADAKIGDVTIKIINLHLEAFDKEARVKSASVVRDLFQKYSAVMPVLLIGDFNSKPDYVEDDAMSVILSSQFAQSAISQTMYERSPESYFTFDSRDPHQMIDFIIYNENFIKSINGEVLREAGEISDHLPVLMEFVLKAEIDND